MSPKYTTNNTPPKMLWHFFYMAICVGKLPYHIHHIHVFVQIWQKCWCICPNTEISWNFKMYLSQLQNVFVQIAERQNSNTISFVSHSPIHRNKNTKILMLSPVPVRIYDVAVFKDFPYVTNSLTFLHRVLSNVSSNCLPEKSHSHIGCIFLLFSTMRVQMSPQTACTRG